MPRIVLSCVALWLAACVFNADYRGGRYLCSDGVCPSGSACVAGVCQAGTPEDAHAGDGTAAALTCASPGAVTPGTPATGSTVGRANGVSALCGASIANGPDAVYALAIGSGSSFQISIAGDYAVGAYALAACQPAPATPACEGGSAAIPGVPITVTPSAGGTQYVVVDSVSPLQAGSYTLTVAVP